MRNICIHMVDQIGSQIKERMQREIYEMDAAVREHVQVQTILLVARKHCGLQLRWYLKALFPVWV